MTDDEIDFGGNLADSPPWMAWTLLALVVYCLVAKYLL